MAGLYIHIPFCIKKCLYCDFYSVENGGEFFEDYVNALVCDIRSAELKNIESVFIGGGTPTALPEKLLERLLAAIAAKVSPAEFTVEANPGTVSESKLRIFKDMGVTRLSIGLQAWQDRLLKIIGRIHTRKDFVYALELAEKFGFDINADVMFNLPSQTADEWEETLFRLSEFDISHISCYSLTVAENTPFSRKLPFPLPGEDDERKMYKTAVSYLSSIGINRYEISNFARPGHECRHNLCYWKLKDYAAFGAGAHGFENGIRYFYGDSIKDYISGKAPETEEVLYEKDMISEYCMLALRLSEGINKTEFERKFGKSVDVLFENAIEKNVRLGFLKSDENSVRLTDLGFDFANSAAADFI